MDQRRLAMASPDGLRPLRSSRPSRLDQALGVASLGLGVVQLAAPRSFARSIGATEAAAGPGLVRLIGAREILAGAGLLGGRPGPFLWMRLAGDAMDLVLLRRAASRRGAQEDRLSAATAGVLGIGAADLVGAISTLTDEDGPLAARRVQRSITIGRTPAEVYGFWRNLEGLPRFMQHLRTVRELDERRSHWVATAPFGGEVEWDAEMTSDEADREIGWRALPGAQVQHEGVVRFVPAPGDRGTEVHVELRYAPPAGALGVAIAKISGQAPEQQVAADLRRLKQLLETGQVVRSEATVGGRRIRQRPAEPLEGAPPAPVEASRWAQDRPVRTSADGGTGAGGPAGGHRSAPAARATDARDGKQQPVQDGAASAAGGTR
jgi:uncharacterized membrane protein